MSQPTIRFIVRRKTPNWKGERVFAHSYGAPESMYTTLTSAKRQALYIGDQVFKIDLSDLGSECPVLGYDLVYTRDPKPEKKARAKKKAEATPKPSKSEPYIPPYQPCDSTSSCQCGSAYCQFPWD